MIASAVRGLRIVQRRVLPFILRREIGLFDDRALKKLRPVSLAVHGFGKTCCACRKHRQRRILCGRASVARSDATP
ncbi:hypothetical protein, partial [Ralstonia pseudosolanacearum]|uniref:hypothetical protein n=1 Tax=Ralstonia pseudosolanacearum TaxID=1310165 RepID=UPI003C7AD923